MNRNHILSVAMAALAALAAGHACAGEIADDATPFVSTATRAQVQEELRQYRAAGVDPWADDYNPLHDFHSGMTRAGVKAEYLADRAGADALNSEDSGSSYLARAHAPSMRRGHVAMAGTK